MQVALVFPGQGSQRPGMGAPWVGTPGWSVVEQASQALGRDLAPMLLTHDAAALQATASAQLSSLLLSLVVLRSLPELPVTVVAGHSLGEVTALVAADVLSEPDAVRLVAARGEAMQQAADQRAGTMATVLGLSDEQVREVCAGLVEVGPAAYNAPGHVVVSGAVEAVRAAADRLRAAGARRVLPLPVGGAFHSPLMAPARPALEQALAAVSWQPQRVQVLCGSTAAPHEPGQVPDRLLDQLTEPVRWRQTAERLAAPVVVEVGAGGVLTGLVRRSLPEARVLPAATPDDLARLDLVVAA